MPNRLPLITQSQLELQCHQLGLIRGDKLMIHASLRTIGRILGGADILINALKKNVGNDGTLMMFVGCQPPFDDVGRGVFSKGEEEFIMQHCPPFDPAVARASRDFGTLAEFFRTTPGVVCSANPGMRMAASGADAAFLTDNHPLSFGFGKNSPLQKFCDLGGKVILIGSDFDQVTMLHYAEALAPIENKRTLRLQLPLAKKDLLEWIPVEEFDTSLGIRIWPKRFFADIVEKFIHGAHCAAGQLGNATVFVLDAKQLVEFAIPIMVEAAARIDAAPG